MNDHPAENCSISSTTFSFLQLIDTQHSGIATSLVVDVFLSSYFFFSKHRFPILMKLSNNSLKTSTVIPVNQFSPPPRLPNIEDKVYLGTSTISKYGALWSIVNTMGAKLSSIIGVLSFIVFFCSKGIIFVKESSEFVSKRCWCNDLFIDGIIL